MVIVMKLAFKTLISKKRDLVISVILLTFVTSLIFGAAATYRSYRVSFSDYVEKNYGTYHGFIDAEQMDKTDGHHTLTSINSALTLYGTLTLKNSRYDGILRVGHVQSDALKLLPIEISSGRMPENEGEAAIEESLARTLESEIDPDSRILIGIKTAGGDELLELTVTGFLEDRAIKNPHDNNGKCILPSVLLAKDNNLAPEKIYFITGGHDKTISGYGVTEMNPRYDPSKSVSSIDTPNIVILSVLAVGLALTVICCLYAFTSLNAQKTSELCLNFKYSGGGVNKTMAFALIRSALVFLFAVIPGAAAGYLASYLFSKNILTRFIDTYVFLPSAGAATVGILAALLVLEVFTFVKNAKIVFARPLSARPYEIMPVRKNIKTNDLFFKWMLCFRLNRGKIYRGLVLTAFLGFTVVFAGGALISAIRADPDFEDSFDDYSAVLTGGFGVTKLRIPANPFGGIDAKTIETLSDTGEVRSLSYIRSLDVIADIAPEDPVPGQEWYIVSEELSSDDIIKTEVLKKAGIEHNVPYFSLKLSEFDRGLLEKLCTDLLRGMPVETLSDGKHVAVVCRDGSLCPYSDGDNVKIKQILFTDDRLIEGDFELFDAEVSVAGVAVLPESDSELYNKLFPGKNRTYFVWGEGCFEKKGLSLGLSSLFVGLKDTSDRELTDKIMQWLNESGENLRVLFSAEQREEGKALVSSVVMSLFGAGAFVFAVFLMTFLGVTVQKFRIQSRLWGVFRTLGISKKKVYLFHFADLAAVFVEAEVLCAALILSLRLLPVRRDFLSVAPYLWVAFALFPAAALLTSYFVLNGVFGQRIVTLLEENDNKR